MIKFHENMSQSRIPQPLQNAPSSEEMTGNEPSDQGKEPRIISPGKKQNKTVAQPEDKGNLKKFTQFEKRRDMVNKSHKISWEKQMEDLFNAFKPPDSSGSSAQKVKQPWQFKFWDISNQFLSVVNNELIASPQNSNSPESSFDVVPNTSLDSKRNPIFIGANNRVLSCIKSGDGQLQLKLMEENIMNLYRTPENFKNFTFYSKSDGRPEICTFESAEFADWFVSTSSESNKPIGLSQKGGPENILFYFTKIS